MRPATKHWLLLVMLVLSLAAMMALALWQMAKARREARTRPGRPPASSRADFFAPVLARRRARP